MKEWSSMAGEALLYCGQVMSGGTFLSNKEGKESFTVLSCYGRGIFNGEEVLFFMYI